MSRMLGEGRRRNVTITDLDESDPQSPVAATSTMAPSGAAGAGHRKAGKRRERSEKKLHTISGNFNRRSRSVECSLDKGSEDKRHLLGNVKVQSYFNELLQEKDAQMDKLLQRLSTLHKFNEQFSNENRKLREEVDTLDERIADVRQQLANCDGCQRLTQQVAQITTRNQTLEADIEMMKTLVYRLNVQIESYQDRLRQAKELNGPDDVVSTSRRTSALPQWRDLHTSTLAPLLQSYDEMIRDKEQLIQQYSQEFEHFTGELKRVLEENNRLLQQNDALKKDMGGWRDERTCLQAQIEVCRKKTETQTRKSDLAREKLQEVMQSYEQKVQTLILDMEHLQSAYVRCKAELASYKSISTQPQESIAQSLQECKELLEQLKAEHSKEKRSLELTIDELRVRLKECEEKLEKTKLENSKLKTELEQQTDAAGDMRRRTDSLERSTEKLKQSRDRLKARLRIALQWAQKLEEGQANMQGTWDALRRLETIVKHKESQVRGLHARHLEEIDKMNRKLFQKEETIRTILKGKLNVQHHTMPLPTTN